MRYIMNNQKIWIGLDSYSRSSFFNPFDTILILISRSIDCRHKIKELEVVFLWLSSPDHVRVTDEAWIAKTLKYGPCLSFSMKSLLSIERFRI